MLSPRERSSTIAPIAVLAACSGLVTGYCAQMIGAGLAAPTGPQRDQLIELGGGIVTYVAIAVVIVAMTTTRQMILADHRRIAQLRLVGYSTASIGLRSGLSLTVFAAIGSALGSACAALSYPGIAGVLADRGLIPDDLSAVRPSTAVAIAAAAATMVTVTACVTLGTIPAVRAIAAVDPLELLSGHSRGGRTNRFGIGRWVVLGLCALCMIPLLIALPMVPDDQRAGGYVGVVLFAGLGALIGLPTAARIVFSTVAGICDRYGLDVVAIFSRMEVRRVSLSSQIAVPIVLTTSFVTAFFGAATVTPGFHADTSDSVLIVLAVVVVVLGASAANAMCFSTTRQQDSLSLRRIGIDPRRLALGPLVEGLLILLVALVYLAGLAIVTVVVVVTNEGTLTFDTGGAATLAAALLLGVGTSLGFTVLVLLASQRWMPTR